MSQLADNVAAAVSPSTPVTLDMKNLSSLDPSDANRIASAFQNELQHHSLNLVSAGSLAGRTAIPLHLTLSESAGAYLWVIQIFNNPRDPNSFSAGIVSVSKKNASAIETDQPFVSLDQRLVWRQPGKFLDFAITKDSSVGDAALLILETDRLSVYKLSGAEWLLVRQNPAPPALWTSRDPDGLIEPQAGYVYVGGQECTAGPSLTDALHCAPPEQSHARVTQVESPAGEPHTLGALISGGCRDQKISLFTGEGDWTQPDLIQGYLSQNFPLPITPSGSPIEFDGPVMSLQSDSGPSAARAVVHNLKTGNYEAYLVTATCSH